MLKNSPNTSEVNSLPQQNILFIQDYGIFTLDPDGIVVFWNQGAQNVQGYSADETIGKPFGALYEKEVHKPRGYFNELLDKARSQGYFEEEGWRQHKEGHYFWTIIVIEPIYDTQRNVTAYTVISRNLTNRKLAAEISEITEADHETLVLATSNIIWTRSHDGQFTAPHLQWEHFTGQIWPEYQGFGWLKMHPLEEHEKIKAFWQKLQSLNINAMEQDWQTLQQTSMTKDLLFKTKLWSKIHREYRHVITTAVPRFNKYTNTLNWLGNEKDVHKMTVLELQLKEVLEEQHLIINSARIGLWRWDLKANAIKLDQNVAAYFGIDLKNFHHSLDEIIACIHPDDRTVIQDLLQKCIQTGLSFKTEFRVIWPDNTIHHMAGNSEVQYDEQHHPLQLLGSFWDITERKELEEKRLQALQALEKKERQRAEDAEAYKQKLEEFIDTICHEVRNPLNGVYSSITFLQEALFESQGLLQEEGVKLYPKIAKKIASTILLIHEQIETLDKCAQQQKTILDDALDLSKLENDKIELNPKPFNLKACMAFILQMFHAQITEKKLNVTYSPGTDIFLMADQQRLAQVIINLVSNAIKFTAAGSITISATLEPSSTSETQLYITIKDTGIGMTEEECARLFQKFKQASREITAKYGGSGLGLVIGKKLVERMGGNMQVASQKGQGTEFNFTIATRVLSQQEYQAYADSLTTLSPPNLTSSKPISSKNILVVEDNSMNQTILKRYLERGGHKCEIANNGHEALAQWEKLTFDLIFMDIEMPEMNGLQATQEIRKRERELGIETAIVGLSGNANKEERDAALSAGMNGYLTKPFRQADIYQAITQYTSSTQPLTEQLLPLQKDSLLISTASEIFKAEAGLLLHEHYPFLVNCEENFILIRLEKTEKYFTEYFCGIILQDLKNHLIKVEKILEITAMTVTQDGLTIETADQIHMTAVKHFLSEVGFDYTFNQPTENLTENSLPTSSADVTTLSYSGSLFTLKKTKSTEQINCDDSKRLKKEPVDTPLKILEGLLEKYQSLPHADQDYITTIKRDMSHSDTHPNPIIDFETHIRMLQIELEKSQAIQNQLKRK